MEVSQVIAQYIESISKYLHSSELVDLWPLLIVPALVVITTIILKRKKTSSLEQSSLQDLSHQDIPQGYEPHKEYGQVQTLPIEKDFKQRLQQGLSKSRQSVWGKFRSLLTGKVMDKSSIEEIEALLYQADISVPMVNKILLEVEKQQNADEIYAAMKKLMLHLLKELEVQKDLENSWSKDSSFINQGKLQVVMIVGVNGVGKTTTVGKLAAGLSKNGQKLVVAAADTFRAAAKEQLKVWCDRAGAELITGHENNQDPAAVCYQAVARALELKADYCLLDTAGRLHNNDQLMEELKKIKRVISKLVPEAPQETLIVLDAMTGQNALKQALQFKAALDGLSGVILTKCDGSAKAGCALSIVEQLQVPIRFIGVGETLEDLNIFKAEQFVDALLTE